MKVHTAWGAEMMAGVPCSRRRPGSCAGTRKRPDGGGYPDGLAELSGSLEAGIVSVCDAGTR